ncbi:hypothetical protein WJX73_009572 [Symbiochloris irregularis]|uniref:Uncharacterized protein n=1 Tax=Symbiochloris irregularis TaxID=706552 RepID=A0AAW1NS35_9CHLO
MHGHNPVQVKAASAAQGLNQAHNESVIDRAAAALKAVAAGDKSTAVALAASLPVPPRGRAASSSVDSTAQLVDQAAEAARQEGIAKGMDERVASSASARAAHSMHLAAAAPSPGSSGVVSAFAEQQQSMSPSSAKGSPVTIRERLPSTGMGTYDEYIDESALKYGAEPATPAGRSSGVTTGGAASGPLGDPHDSFAQPRVDPLAMGDGEMTPGELLSGKPSGGAMSGLSSASHGGTAGTSEGSGVGSGDAADTKARNGPGATAGDGAKSASADPSLARDSSHGATVASSEGPQASPRAAMSDGGQSSRTSRSTGARRKKGGFMCCGSASATNDD